MQNIPIGGQIRISGELNEKQIDIIIQFHIKYGMIKFSDLNDFKGYFIPCIYRIDEPIPAEVITELIVQNREHKKLVGEKLRAEAAVAVNAMIEENAQGQLTNFEMEIKEAPSKDRDPTINETIRVTRSKDLGAPQEPKSTMGVVTDFLRPRRPPRITL